MFKDHRLISHPFDQVPLGEDIFLMDEIWIKRFDKALTRMFDDGKYPLVGRISYAAARTIDQHAIELSWYPNLHNRFHEVKVILPRDKFVACVDCWSHDIKPRLFVKSDWLKNLFLRVYSTFILVDAIGIKNALRAGTLGSRKLLSLRKGLDKIAKENPNVAFISFADSLLLKANWRVGMYNSTIKYNYQPEKLLTLLLSIRALYRNVAGLEIYSILAQGYNEYPDRSPTHISASKNHISLNSLGLPFAQLLAIDGAARKAIKEGVHQPAQIYLDEDFFFSLGFKFQFEKHKEPKHHYEVPMQSHPGTYYYTDLDELISNLEIPSRKRRRRAP